MKKIVSIGMVIAMIICLFPLSVSAGAGESQSTGAVIFTAAQTNDCALIFDKNSHFESYSECYVDFSESLGTLPVLPRTDEGRFTGWKYVDPLTGEEEKVSSVSTIDTTLDFRLYPIYDNRIRISFLAGNGVCDSADIYIAQDEAIGTLPQATAPTGATFQGWYLFHPQTGEKIAVDENTKMSQLDIDVDVRLYAQYSNETTSPTNNSTSNVSVSNANDFQYTMNSEGKAVICGYTGTKSDLEIPETLNGYTVEEIGANAFLRSTVKSVWFPSTLKRIQDYAFYDCDSLLSLHFSGDVQTIGAYAFAYCSALNAVLLPENLTSIGHLCFEYDVKLYRLELTTESSQLYISPNAFSECQNISFYGQGGKKLQEISQSMGTSFVSVDRGIVISDIPQSNWGYPYAKYVVSRDIMKCIEQNAFQPDVAVTRGMIVTALYQLVGEPPVSTGNSGFTDVDSGLYYSDAVKWAVEIGITNGTTPTTFSPNNPVKRQDAAVMIARFLTKCRGIESITSSSQISSLLSRYSDVSAISDYARASVALNTKFGILGGIYDEFKPSDNLTRIQLAKIAMLLYKL